RIPAREQQKIMELHQPEAQAREGRAVFDRARPSLALRAGCANFSPVRAWVALVTVSLQRQARMRQMVWIALGLLLLTTVIVAAIRYDTGWGMYHWRWPRRVGPVYNAIAETYDRTSAGVPFDPETAAFHQMGSGAFEALLRGAP